MMIRKLKRDFTTLFALAECASYGQDCPCFLVPSTPDITNLPLTGSALCLMDLINRNIKITPRLLMSSYTVWIGKLAKAHEARLELLTPELLRSVHLYLTHHTTVGIAPVSELNIDSPGLPRLAPLAFYIARYKKLFDRNPPFMYHLNHELSTLTVGHRRASVAAGFYIDIATSLILARLERKKALTPTRVKKVIRQSAIKTFIYYNSTYEYKGEAGYYALLQQNKEQKMHIEGIPLADLQTTKYALDTLLITVWMVFKHSSFNKALTVLETLGHPEASALIGGLFGIAYGREAISVTNKKRFEDLLKSL